MKRMTWLLLVFILFVFASGCCSLKCCHPEEDLQKVKEAIYKADQWVKDNLW